MFCVLLGAQEVQPIVRIAKVRKRGDLCYNNMANLSPTPNVTGKPPYRIFAKVVFLALAYFVAGRLGLAIPYVDSHITLIWLPTGIALAALLRWGNICWPGILLGAFATNFSIDSSPLLDSSIALGNTLAAILAAWLLRRLRFQGTLHRAYDILLLVTSAVAGMMVSASIGVGSLVIFNVLPVETIGTAWVSWWAGDFTGVLLAAPMLLNISRAALKELWALRVELSGWFITAFVVYGGLFLLKSDELRYLHQLAFIGLPPIVWAAMRFGVVGSSLAVLLSVFITVAGTSHRLGPLYSGEPQQGMFQLWAFFFTLVLVQLMVAGLQSGRKRAEEALRLEIEFTKEMINSLPGIFYLFDSSGRFLVWNKNLESVLRCGSEEMARSNPLDFFEGSDRILIKESIDKTFETGETTTEAALVAKNGARIPYLFTGRAIHRNGERLLVGMGIDVTERQRILNETEAHLKRNQTLMKTVLDGIYVLDTHGNIVEVNDIFCNMLGYTQKEASQLNIADWNSQLSKEELLERLKNLVGTNARFETVHRRKDGALIDVEVSATGVQTDGQAYFFCSSRDITERKQAEQKAEVLMRRHEALMKSALEGIHIMDMQGNIVEANDTFCAMLGYTREEVIKLNVADWDTQWSREELMERFKQLILLNSALFETKHRRKDGIVIDVEVSTTGAEIGGRNYLYASSRDISMRKRVEQELRDSERKLRMLMDSAADAVFVADPETKRWLYVNDRFSSLLGYSRKELLGGSIFDLVAPDYRDVYRDRFQAIAQSGVVSNREFRLTRKGGDSVLLEMNAVTLPDGTVYGSCRDITERKKIEEGQRIAAATFETQEAILITDPQGNILRVNKAFNEVTGYDSAEVIGKSPRIFQSGRHDSAFYKDMWSALLNTGKWSGEVWDKRKNGEIYPKAMTITAVYDDKHQSTHYVAVFRDITRSKQSEQEIHRLAFYDSLTMLPNRRLLLDRLQQAVAVSARNGRHGALMYLDLDHFKTINDTQGHKMGDLLLIEVARRLQTCVREGDSVARLGGDEFVVVLEDLSGVADDAASQTEFVAEKIRGELGQPYLLKEYECQITASIGISLFRGHLESAENLLQHADVAMYQAKTAGRNIIRFFDPHMQTLLEMRADMEADLRHALEKQQFRLFYQIQVDVLRRPLGAEVLLRWDHPERGMVTPGEFIALAEEIGLIVPIGLWVLRKACMQLEAWRHNALTRDLTLAVNVSAKQFRHADFVDQVRRVLLESGAKPSHLKLELTETHRAGKCRRHHQQDARTETARSVLLDGRLWHWLLVAAISQAIAARPDQDRSILCARNNHQSERRRDRANHYRDD